MLEENEHRKAMDGIEALLKDIEKDLAQRGDLTDEDKAAIERLLELCDRGEILLARDED